MIEENLSLQKLGKIYEGKAKILYETSDPSILIQYFKDDITAFNSQKKDVISSKGILNNYISEYIMLELDKSGIDTHFLQRIDNREQLIRRVEIIPLEIIVRRMAAGTFCKRYGFPRGYKFSKTVVEMCLKNDSLGDPLICPSAIVAVNIATEQELNFITQISLKISEILENIFSKVDLSIIDFKVEFGRDKQTGKIILADEISPDSCRVWDAYGNTLDKDLYRNNTGDIIEGYGKIMDLLGIKIKS